MHNRAACRGLFKEIEIIPIDEGYLLEVLP